MILSLENNCEISDNESNENTSELNVITNMSVGELSVAAGGEVTASANISAEELSLAIGGEVTAGARANMSVEELSVALVNEVTTRVWES